MSCDYFVWCRDCAERHEFNDANHRIDLMHALIRNRDAIAALVPLRSEVGEITLQTYYGHIDVYWFAKHAGHELAVIDEYGKIDGSCGEFFLCPSSDHRHSCRLDKGHPPPCSAKSRRPAP